MLIHHCGSLGGAGVSLLHIVDSIDKTKYKLVVLCPDYPDEMTKLLQRYECEVISSKTSPKVFNHCNGGISNALSLNSIKNLLEIIKDKKYIQEYIKDVNPDIVAVNSMTLFWIGKVAKKMNKRAICFHRETYQRGLFGFRSKIIKRGLSEWFDKVAFVSWNDLNETGNTKAIKTVVYDRVNISSFNNYTKQQAKQLLGLEDRKKYILYLGGMTALKGSDIIMESMKYLDDENAVLIFIGETEHVQRPSFKQTKKMKEKLKYLLAKGIYNKTLNPYFKYELCDKVIFRKRTENPELYYKACDLVVFPSTKAHQARPIYEAGISRIPIVITDFEQTKEFAENKVTALTFRNKDSHDLADKINMILHGQIDLQKLVNNNYLQTVQKHDLSTLKNDLSALFEFD